jgi:hypothetical protein
MAMSCSALAELDPFSTMTKISYADYRFPPEIIQTGDLDLALEKSGCGGGAGISSG